jgi:hypothetical protein
MSKTKRDTSPLSDNEAAVRRNISHNSIHPFHIKLKRNISDNDGGRHIDAETVEVTEDGKIGYKIITGLYYKSQAGTNDSGVTKTNQDSHVVIENIFGLENYNIFGVLDGHGNRI